MARAIHTNIRLPARALALCLLPLACAPAGDVDTGSADAPSPGFIYGRVTKVKDGDSLVMRTPTNAPVEVRLAEIDTPEKGAPYADAARRVLTRLVRDRDVAVRRFDVDQYDRLVGRVFVNGFDVNAELVRQGLAAVYCRFAEDRQLYALEDEARRAGRGFWSGDSVPRGACRQAAASPPPALEPGCGDKRFCREMASCDEALYYLNECGLTSMDGDGDGIPCERGVCANSE
jgi:endonuclease YncB( thermonuclease family)